MGVIEIYGLIKWVVEAFTDVREWWSRKGDVALAERDRRIAVNVQTGMAESAGGTGIDRLRQFQELRLLSLAGQFGGSFAPLLMAQDARTAVETAHDLNDYPIVGGRHALRDALSLSAVGTRQTPLVLLVPPYPSSASRWGNSFVERVEAALASYHDVERGRRPFYVRTADRPFRWPHPGLYRDNLVNVPTVVVLFLRDHDQLSIQLAGCHLGPFDQPGVLIPRVTHTLRFQEREFWSGDVIGRLNATRAADRHPLGAGTDLTELNHELVARVATLCVVAAIDCHHIMSTPAYDELIDDAIDAATVIDQQAYGERVLDMFDMPLGAVADPAYHLLQQAVRQQRHGKNTEARRTLQDAIRLLGGDQADAVQPIGHLLRQAVAVRLMHARHVARLSGAIAAIYPGRGLEAILAGYRSEPFAALRPAAIRVVGYDPKEPPF